VNNKLRFFISLVFSLQNMDFATAFKTMWDHLLYVPGELLSLKGLADSIGFMTLAMANNAITPPLKEALKGMPLAPWFRSVVDGAVMKANFIYGNRCHDASSSPTNF
jgi:hypothetical protein